MAQAQLDIILNAQKYQRDLVKTLGLTEKQAAAQALRMAREGKKAADKAAQAQQRAAKKSGDAWKKAFTAAGLVALAAFAQRGAMALKELATSVIDYRNELGDMNVRTGVAAETIQAFQVAAEGVGLTIADVTKITAKLPKLLADVAAGSATATRGFKGLGIEARKTDGSLITTEELFGELVDAADRLADSEQRVTKFADLMGAKLGGTFLQAVQGGAEHFKILREEAEEFGVKNGPEAAQSAAAMQRDFARLGLVLRGVKADIVDAFGGNADEGLDVLTHFGAGLRSTVETIRGYSNVKTVGFLDAFDKDEWKRWAEDIGQVFIDAEEAALSFYGLTDRERRTVGGASAALAAYNEEIERNSRGTKKAIDPQKQLQADIAKSAEALKRLGQIADAAAQSQLSDEEKIEDALANKLIAIGEVASKIENADQRRIASERAVMAVNAEAEGQRIDLAKRTAQELADIRDQRRADDEADAERQRLADLDLAHARISNAAMAAFAIGDIATLTAGKNKEAQRRAWRVNQAAAVSGALLNTALAVSNAFADVPFPANFAAAALAGIAGAAQAASVAASPAPSFYEGTGSSPYASPSGSMITAQLHPREVFKVENQSEAQRGPGPTFVETWVNGRSIATTVASEIRRGGEIAAEITRRTGRLGHSPAYRSA